jgi:hypothetical protein
MGSSMGWVLPVPTHMPPLAFQALGRALAGVANLMLEDLEGSARLFKGTVLDA